MGQMKRRVLGTTTPFHAFKKKKKGAGPGDASPGTVHLLLHWAARVADFKPCLLPRLYPKFDKACTNMSTWNTFILENGPVGQKNFETAPFIGPKSPPRSVCSLGLPNLAIRGAHFEPTVWIPRVESRADTFSPLKTRLPSFQPYK
jgi:hypothetical protein